MKHLIMVTVDGYSWIATALTHHNGKQRQVSRVSCEDIPTHVLGTLADHLIDANDVLEVVRNYLNDTATAVTETQCGPIAITWSPLDRIALRDDLTGNTYHVKLTDQTGQAHEYDVGAATSWHAFDMCKAALQLPIRSSIVQPMGY